MSRPESEETGGHLFNQRRYAEFELSTGNELLISPAAINGDVHYLLAIMAGEDLWVCNRCFLSSSGGDGRCHDSRLSQH